MKLRTDGWKQLDGGGDTGFDKDDASLWLAAGDVDLRAGYAHETSDETYLGLTDADLAASPDRRYRATADDQMNWSHVRLRADYRRALSSRARLAVTAYRHDFHRRWGKVDAFVGERDLDAVLSAPDAGAHPIFYAVLTGAADSQSPEEELIRGTNDRTFVSQGASTEGTVTVAQSSPTEFTITLSGFSTGDGDDLRLWLNPGALVKGDDGYYSAEGNTQFELPGTVSPSDPEQIFTFPITALPEGIQSLTIYDYANRVAFGSAPLD